MDSPRGSANDVEGEVGTGTDIDEGQEQETSDWGEDDDGMELEEGSPQDLTEFSADEDMMDDDNDNEDWEEFPSDEFPWLKTIDIHIKASDAVDSPIVGECTARLIDRDQIRATFHRDMEEISNDAANLAFDVFDRWGCLKSAYQRHPIKKGTGVWGPELNSGRFLLIETLAIEEQYQRKGYGKKLFRQVWEKAQEMVAQIDDKWRADRISNFKEVWGTEASDREPPIAFDDWIDRVGPGLRSGQQEASACDFAIVWAEVLNTREVLVQADGLSSAESEKFYQEKYTALEHYWRAMGFRRIGSSPYFCLAKDSEHPAHLLAPQDDYMRPAALRFSPRGGVQDFPILTPVPEQGNFEHTTLKDIEAKELLEARLQSHPATHPSWLSVDRHGNNILHILAREYKSEALTWTLSLPFADSLRSVRNFEGETPLEALETQIESDRSFREVALARVVTADKYSGLASNQLQCLERLKCIESPSHDELRRLCFGCTCGLCLGGFLSPRAAYSLECQGDMSYDLLNESLGYGDAEDWCDSWDGFLEHLAPRVKANLRTNKSMRQGYTNLFSFISPTLKAKRLPTTRNILDLQAASNEWPPVTRHYLQRGGTVHAVLQACFDRAILHDQYLGDGFHEEVFQSKIDALPVCRNDREFVFARRQCRRLEGLPDEVDPRVGMGGIW